MSRSERSPLLLTGPPAAAGAAPFATPRPHDAPVPRGLAGTPAAVGRPPLQALLVLRARSVAQSAEGRS